MTNTDRKQGRRQLEYIKEDQESQARRALFNFQESWCLHFPGIMPRRSGPIMYETLWDIVVHLSSQREKASDPRDIALTL
jgi:hypothetical protein